MSTLLLTALLGLAAGAFFILRRNRKGNLPPGPFQWPLVGNALSVPKKPHLKFMEWAKTYGDIMTVQIFDKRIIVINNVNIAREAFNKLPLMGRAYLEPFEVYFKGVDDYPEEVARGVLGSEGPVWVEQRRFTLRHLRDFGFGKHHAMEEHIREEVSQLLAWVRDQKGQPVRMWRRFAQATSNVLWRIIAGEGIHQKQDETAIIEAATQHVLGLLDEPIPVFLPWLSKFFGKFSGWNKLITLSDKMHEIFYRYVEAHQRNFSPDNPPEDFIDAYLKKISETTDKTSSFYGENGVLSLKLTVSDLFIAGSETTASTLNWAVLFLTTFPEIRKKVQEEIQQVVGHSRSPTIADRASMPYTEAFVNETLRKSSHTTFGVMHRALQDTELNGYSIPKDSWVGCFQYYIHHDPRIWGDPDNFRPERFLTTDAEGNQTIKKFEEFLPFSIGKRLCIGEQLAKEEIFVFVTSLFQHFDTQFDQNDTAPTLDPRTSMFQNPEHFKVILTERR
jgi:cytochrome P450 family 2 subfamily J